MKFDDLLHCVACGALFRPIREEDICASCEKLERERLEMLAREAEE